MSKIGDLIVRMQLKYDDYKKGLKNASAETKGFAGTLGKIKGVGLAVWAAIGAAALKMGKAIINSNNALGDAWARTTSQLKAGWDTFIKSVAAWDWDNFIGRIKESTAAAKNLANALDAQYEISNSIKLQRSAIEAELAELEILAKDQTKSYAERANAAKKYLDLLRPIYDQELKLAEKMEAAYFGKWISGTGLKDSESLRKSLREFVVAIGRDEGLYDDLSAALQLRNDREGIIKNGGSYAGKEYKQKTEEFVGILSKWQGTLWNTAEEFNLWVDMFKGYELLNSDVDTTPLVEAWIKADKARAAFDSETKRMQTLLNSSVAKMENETTIEATAEKIKEWGHAIEPLPKIAANATIAEIPDIIPDDWLERNRENIDAALAEAERLAGITDEINRNFESAIVSSVSGATQALTDCIAGIEGADATRVLAALMQPFADTMIKLGEMLIAEGLAISAFKESLKSLNPYVALAAGAALLAVGAALSSGIQKLGATAGSGATTTSTSASSSASGIQNVQSELTIYVKGSLKGSDIVLSGQRTLNSWAR